MANFSKEKEEKVYKYNLLTLNKSFSTLNIFTCDLDLIWSEQFRQRWSKKWKIWCLQKNCKKNIGHIILRKPIDQKRSGLHSENPPRSQTSNPFSLNVTLPSWIYLPCSLFLFDLLYSGIWKDVFRSVSWQTLINWKRMLMRKTIGNNS